MITSDYLKQLENDVLLAKSFWEWHQNSGPDVPFSSALYSDISNRLYDAYQAVYEAYIAATHERRMTWMKTPTIAPVTDLDPQSATLPEGRYHGTLNKNRLYIHVPALRADFRVIPAEICGASVETISVGQVLEVSINASFETALRVVIVGNQDSVKAYEAKTAPQPARVDLNRRPRNLAEARLQADQRKKDAAQREQARKEAHQPQNTRYVFYNNDGTYDIDDKDGYEIEF